MPKSSRSVRSTVGVERIEHETTTGSVFEALGNSPAKALNLRIRADLMIRITRLIEQRGLTQAQSARVFGVTQPRISDLVSGRIGRFSVDMLITMLGRAGVDVRIIVEPKAA
jgi:predicted XRE-type DNA-binding protein